MSLKDFPAPSNGIGIHFDLDVRADKITTHIPLMVQMHMSWGAFYVGDELQARVCADFAWKNGILPIIRPKCTINGAQPNWAAIVRAVLATGAPAYVQVYNEPGDPREWKLSPPLRLLHRLFPSLKRGVRKRSQSSTRWLGNYVGYNQNVFAQNWRNAAAQVVVAGGFPGLQTLDQSDVVAALNNLPSEIASKVWFASHAYASGHPPNYPYDVRNQQDHPGATVFTDDTCVLRFLEESKWARDALGFDCPLFVTEGGWVMQEQDDRRYPRIDENLHSQYHTEVFNWFRVGKLSNGDPLPDTLFGFAPFLLYDPDYQFFSWVSVAPKTIEAVKAMPTFTRKFSWGGDPVPIPIPMPPPATNSKKIFGIYVTPNGRPPIEWWGKVKPPYAVSMDHDPNYWAEVLRISPDTQITGRHYFEDQSLAHRGFYRLARRLNFKPTNKLAKRIRSKRLLALSPQSCFDIMRSEMERMKPYYKRWMRFNEIASFTPDDAKRYNDSELEWMRLMDAAGFKCAILSHSEGHPELNLLQYFVPAFDYAIKHGHTYKRHEYDVPMNRTAPWRCLRATLEAAELAKYGIVFPDGFVEVGEAGRDGGVSGVNQPQKGFWFFGGEDDFISDLKWYVGELLKHKIYRHVALFCWKWDVTNTFDLEGATKVADFMAIPQPIPIMPAPIPPTNWQAIADAQYPAKNLNAIAIAAMCLRAGFTPVQTITAGGIILAESGGNPQAIHVNSAPGKAWDQSVDRGLSGFNDWWFYRSPKANPKISHDCAFNPMCSILQMYVVSQRGTNFSRWTTYNVGAHEKYKFIMRLALAALGFNV